jgi:hypothetical protein
LVDFVVDQEMRRRYRALTLTAHLALLDALNHSEGAVDAHHGRPLAD